MMTGFTEYEAEIRVKRFLLEFFFAWSYLVFGCSALIFIYADR